MAKEEKEMTAEEKLAKYEEFLSEVIDGSIRREGIILGRSQGSGKENAFDHLYKVRTNNEEIIAKSHLFLLKKGDYVIVVNGTIVEKLPEELILHNEEVEFERIDWSHVGGMKSQIESIRRKVEYPIKHAKLYKEFKLTPSKGILLFGPTGCGKTLIAKVIASQLLKSVEHIDHDLFTYMKGGELLSKYVGEAEARIKSSFERARHFYKEKRIKPIIFIDEAEAILPPRGSRISSDVDTTIVPSFLSEMDGFEGYNPFVILASNYEDRIDNAILRPGRIDLKVYIGRPTPEDCHEIFSLYLKKTKVEGNISDLAIKATEYLCNLEKMQGELSGALIENIVSSAIENAIIRIINGGTHTGVGLDDLTKAINNI